MEPPARRERPSADPTRRRILAAALDLFAERSYDGATTRAIAQRAGVSQPSLNYHFRGKAELWEAAVDEIFDQLNRAMTARFAGLRGVDERTRAELMVREFITFSAAHPQLHRIVTQEGKHDGERSEWLTETHIRPLFEVTCELFEQLAAAGSTPLVPPAFLYYVLTGAGPHLFVLAPEYRRLTGVDPLAPEVVDAYADAVVGLLFPGAT